jgi:hypothetical protein
MRLALSDGPFHKVSPFSGLHGNLVSETMGFYRDNGYFQKIKTSYKMLLLPLQGIQKHTLLRRAKITLSETQNVIPKRTKMNFTADLTDFKTHIPLTYNI